MEKLFCFNEDMTMIKGIILKPVAILTFFFFTCFMLALTGSLVLSADEDLLLKARMLIHEGDFDGAIKELADVITTLEMIQTQKQKVAEAHYLLARIYKIVQTPDKFKYHLKMAFKIYPGLNMEEPDPEIRDMVEQVKAGLAKEKTVVKNGKKRKKKFPVLLTLAGAAVATAVLLLLTKKKEPDTAPYDTGVLGVQWIDIPAGEFLMGDNFNDGWTDEQPVHAVYLGTFKISRYEVTFRQYDIFCDDTDRNRPDDYGWGRDTRPVIDVGWDDARAFCVWLAGKTGKNIHLPTEAQWEKAARGTDQRKYPWGNDEPTCASEMTNFNNCNGRTMPVGSFVADRSPYGVMDMAGNVFEWCGDWYDATYYSISPSTNPSGPAAGTQRVHRGGSWYSDAEHARAIDRDSTIPSGASNRKGFRICQD
jgi:formylglycine-generating enzyme required for sulfatase activity